MRQHVMKMHGGVVVCVHEILTSAFEETVVLNTPATSRGETDPVPNKYEATRIPVAASVE